MLEISLSLCYLSEKFEGAELGGSYHDRSDKYFLEAWQVSVLTISDTAVKLALHYILDYFMMITSCIFKHVLLVMPFAANNFCMKKM